MRSAVLSTLLLLTVFGCSRPAPEPAEQQKTQSSPTPRAEEKQIAAPADAAPAVDACTLLTAEEIAAAQGASVTSATPSSRTQGGLVVAQCYFALPVAADSLSLMVLKKPAHSVEKLPTVLWTDMFHTERPAKKGRDGKPKVQPNPQKIEGIGDEAFWGGGQFGGTLHVRKGEDVFQLSVGGPGDEVKKLESLKQLATKIAERL